VRVHLTAEGFPSSTLHTVGPTFSRPLLRALLQKKFPRTLGSCLRRTPPLAGDEEHMKVQSAKAKGRRLQQKIAADIREHFGLEEDDVRSTSMGAPGEDILLSPRARTVFPYSVEAKNQERLNIWSALEQAKRNATSTVAPLVVFHKNNEDTYVAMPWKNFLGLCGALPGVASSAPPAPNPWTREHVEQLKTVLDGLVTK